MPSRTRSTTLSVETGRWANAVAEVDVVDVRGRRLGVNTLWNLAGGGFPALFALAAIPIVIEGLGTERFGILLLVWALIGYFGLFDMGIGRALTKMTADRLGSGQTGEMPALVWSGIILMAGLGVLGGLFLAAVSEPIIRYLIMVPEAYRDESINCLRVVALGLPLILAASGLSAVVAGHQRFDLINMVRIPFSAASNFGQAAAALAWPDLTTVTTILVAGRVLNGLALLWFNRRLVPLPGPGGMWNWPRTLNLLQFGGWITVSNVIGPLMVYLDRFVIGAMISTAAVAFYATPHEAVTRLLIVPGAIVGVLFPAFATVLQRDRSRIPRLFNGALATNVLLVFPFALVLVGFAEPLLGFWLGPDFAAQSAPVLKVLTVAILLNCVTQVPFTLVQGSGRPDLTAKLHLAELVPYLLVLVWCTQTWGILGAAWVWALRVAVDGWILAIFARRVVPELREDRRPTIAIGAILGAFLLLQSLTFDATVQLALTAAGLIGAPLMIWMWFLGKDERSLLIAMLPARGP